MQGLIVAAAFAGVLTWHNDVARTGQNRNETVLTPANVNAKQFGKLFALPVDGQIYVQPLLLPSVHVRGGGTHDVVFVATEHDSLYAFDAAGKPSTALWHDSFVDPADGVTTVPCTSDRQPECDVTIMSPEHGISGTPVIDPASGTIYLDVKTDENGTFVERLHAIDVTSGVERPGSPVTIAAVDPAYPKVAFDPLRAFQRAGLVLSGGIVYIAYASNDDARGWIVGYDESSLQLVRALCIAPTGNLGGIWNAGAAPAVDDAGNLYALTGNGSFDAPAGGANYGMSALRISPADPLSVTDYFAPYDEAKQSHVDLDLGSGSAMLLPDHAGAHPHEMLAAGKQGNIFVIDRDTMGEFHADGNHVVQEIDANPQGGFYSSPAYFNGFVYYAPAGQHLWQFAVNGDTLSTSPVYQSTATFAYPGATPSISSNADTHGIVWTIGGTGRVRGGPPAVLRAYDANDVGTELYDSKRAGKRDEAGPSNKFAVPTIANGRVYVPTQTEIDVYGLLK